MENTERVGIVSFFTYNRITAGILAGLAGGLLMAAVLCAIYGFRTGSPGFPLKLIAATILGDAALLPSAGLGTVLTGLVLQLIISGFLGGLFGALSLSRIPWRVALEGLIYAAVVWAVMEFVILPTGVNLPLVTRMPSWTYAIAHAVFGLSLTALIPIEKRLIRRETHVVPAEEFPPRQRTATG